MNQSLPYRSEQHERCILMLQGHPSPFWGELYDGLKVDGHRLLKVNFCLADLVYWGRRPAISYRGRYKKWRNWIRQFIRAERVTDILYYADRLPYHVDALEFAKELGIRCWVIEFGYLRPDWITFEPEAMGARSTFPKNPKAIEALANGVAAPDMINRYPHNFATEAFHEVSFHMLQAYGRPFFPFYYSDKIYWPVIDYLSWIGELALEQRRNRASIQLEKIVSAGRLSYNLLAMQLQADYQIRASSKYGHLCEFLSEVFESFARSAPETRHLIVKLHPLDNGLERWFYHIPRLADRSGIGKRVHLIKGGNLSVFLKNSKGVVLVNSTVGVHALRMGLPTFVAGEAVFDMPGLSHQGNLDSFWEKPELVDRKFFDVFERALSRIQVKGSFYNAEGRVAAISNIRERFRSNTLSAVFDDKTSVTDQ